MSRLIALTLVVAAGAMCYFRPGSLDRDAVDFLETRESVLDLLQAGAAQVPDSFLGGLVGDLYGTARSENDARDGVAHGQHLVDADTPFVAIGAVSAALGPEDFEARGHVDLAEPFLEQRFFGNVDRLLAVPAQPSR